MTIRLSPRYELLTLNLLQNSNVFVFKIRGISYISVVFTSVCDLSNLHRGSGRSISHLITSLPGWGLVVLGLVMGALPMSPHGDETSVKIIYLFIVYLS